MEAKGANPLTLLTFSVFHCGSECSHCFGIMEMQ